MATRVPAVLFALALAVWMAACAEPPTGRVEAVQQRIDAMAPEAETYAPQAYRSAQDAAAQLQAELDAQEQRFALTRSYDRAEELAAAAEAAADEVERAIPAERQRLQAESDRLVADAGRAVTGARQSIEGLPAADLPEDQAEAWETDLATAEASLEEAQRLLAAGQLVEARERAEAAAQAASRVDTSVAAVQAEREQARAEVVARAVRGEITLPRAVLASGSPLAAGTYALRLAEEEQPAGEDEPIGRWVEFVRNGTVAGRELAIVVPDAEVGEIAAAPGPRNEARVDVLQGGDYVRVWLNRDGTNYLMHMPPS